MFILIVWVVLVISIIIFIIRFIGIIKVFIVDVKVIVDVVGYFIFIIDKFSFKFLIICCVVGFKLFVSKVIIVLRFINLIFIVKLVFKDFFSFVFNIKLKIYIIIGIIICVFRLIMKFNIFI